MLPGIKQKKNSNKKGQDIPALFLFVDRYLLIDIVQEHYISCLYSFLCISIGLTNQFLGQVGG